MNIGYACLAIGVPGTRFSSCRQELADAARLDAISAQNLQALENLVAYNAIRGIRLFRISSDIIPFGSSPVNQQPWAGQHAAQLARIGALIRSAGMRVSMHPGQYTVLNSPDQDVVERAVADLVYHDRLLAALGTGRTSKIVLHIGGAYGNKQAALERFARQYERLGDAVRSRLVIENDERIFTVADALLLHRLVQVPVVFDNLHHALNRPDGACGAPEPDRTWVAACRATWQAADGTQKIHYAQQAAGKRPGAHSETIEAARFVADMTGLPDDLDVMLEVKDKNLSAVKCINCLSPAGPITLLEQEWARYKYEVLETAPDIYLAIRQLLKDKQAWPALPFYALVEEAQRRPVLAGHAINAAQHVWGYLGGQASERDKRQFARLLERCRDDAGKTGPLKRFLLKTARTQQQPYLEQSLYLTRLL